MNLVSDGRRWVGCWSLLTAGLVLVIFTGGIVFPAVFHLIGINPLKPIFSDLIAILAAVCLAGFDYAGAGAGRGQGLPSEPGRRGARAAG